MILWPSWNKQLNEGRTLQVGFRLGADLPSQAFRCHCLWSWLTCEHCGQHVESIFNFIPYSKSATHTDSVTQQTRYAMRQFQLQWPAAWFQAPVIDTFNLASCVGQEKIQNSRRSWWDWTYEQLWRLLLIICRRFIAILIRKWVKALAFPEAGR